MSISKIFVCSFLLLIQRGHSNPMPCWFQRVAYLITFTMHHDAGHSSDGIKLVLPLVKIVECKCVVLPCFYPVEFHCSRVLNLFAVQNISKVSQSFFFLCRMLFFFSFVVTIVFHLKKKKLRSQCYIEILECTSTIIYR